MSTLDDLSAAERQRRMDRLMTFEQAWRDADIHYRDDVRAAIEDPVLLRQVDLNWYAHQRNWAEAAIAALELGDADVAAAHDLAKAANKTVSDARKNAEKIAAVIRKVGKAAEALTKVLDTVAKAKKAGG